ncbi:hypothetical protein B0H15DRAFT_874408 [Mycena belliarum]|uniref:Uncharacterized protein n=1 Tax=Mycena belliarum TaxID=1033014 RepID=A0AAD6Y1G6_9AGAR|nr:hypothetical protein B0H15DRAFT_874408 [Mycena belliae]
MFDLDNDGQLDFDPFSMGSSSLAMLSAMQRMPETDTPHRALATSPTDDLQGQDSTWKGKGVSMPMPIPSAQSTDFHDVFDINAASSSHNDRNFYASSSPFSASSSMTCASPNGREDVPYAYGSVQASRWKGKDAVSPRSSASITDPTDMFDMGETSPTHAFSSFSSYFSPASSDDPIEQSPTSMGSNDSCDLGGKGKGKEKEQPPTLPPLTFSPTEFHTSWPTSAALEDNAGPSSYTSAAAGPSSYSSLAPLSLISVPVPPAPAMSPTPTVPRPLSRRRSLPSINTKSRLRAKSSLARKLLFRKYDEGACPTPPSSPADGRTFDLGAGSCFAPWRNDSALALELEYQSMPAFKARAQSMPYPVSALDLVPATTADLFAPIRLVVPNYFDDVLPRELRVQVLLSLIVVHEADHARAVKDGQWSVTKATSSRNKWVGRDKALRELVRFSRVSKSWQALVFDGQIWANLDLHAFPLLPKSLLLRIARTAGSFIQDINVAGHVNLHSGTLIEVADSVSDLSGSLPFTHLTGLNLQGCSAITTRSLNHLLIQSRALETLRLKGLAAVTNTTCDIIGVYCTRLVVLDLGRCMKIDAAGVRSITNAAESRGEYLGLKELRLSGLKHVDDRTMAVLGRAAPYLEVLDLSYVRQLHNTAVEAFVACRDDDEEDEENGMKIVCLNAREAGRSIDESNRYRRRVTRLRHLSLSSCLLLTDAACSHLAHSVPELQYLELAGIGSSLEDEGLIRLLNTTPLIKRLDLEDASSISDAVIATLTPAPPEDKDPDNIINPAPESPLEHLIISGAQDVSDAALLALVHGCTRLRVLEADNTRIGSSVLRAFVRAARDRILQDAKVVVIDCRGFGEMLQKDLAPHTRPRLGWRAHGARGLGFLDARDGAAEDFKVGQDECDPARVVVKTFYGWQTVDAVQAGREKRRKARTRRAANDSTGSSDMDELAPRGIRWWSPGGRRSGANSPPAVPEPNSEGCTIM